MADNKPKGKKIEELDPTKDAMVALGMVGVNLNYPSTELTIRTLEKVKELGLGFSLETAKNLIETHNIKWDAINKQQAAKREGQPN